MKKITIRPDVIFKDFWRENDRFASLFNTVVFGGNEVIKPEELSDSNFPYPKWDSYLEKSIL